MRKCLIIICVLITTGAFAKDIKPYTREYLKAASKGPKTKITLRVFDDENNIVTNAVVQSSFGKKWNKWKYQNTDTNGLVVIKGKSGGKLNYKINKDGYYYTRGNYQFSGVGGIIIKDKKWQPWNPTVDGILRKIKKKPIPMYAKEAKVDLPSGNGSFAYDLYVGDLVKPHGIGTSTDLVFHVSTTSTNWRDKSIYHLHGDITFPSVNDGIQTVFVPHRVSPRSGYQMPFIAPESGYSPSLKDANGDTETRYREVGYRKADKSTLPNAWYWTADYHYTDVSPRYWGEEINYFIKVRSMSDGKSCYGLIRGQIRFGYRGADVPWIEFTYFINPDGSRCIEYDPSKNLVTNFGKYKIREYSPNAP